MLVAACKGIYIAGGALAREPVYRKGVKVLRLDEPDANIDVYVAWRSHEKSQDVADFLKIVRDVFRIENAILR
jgi:DNA-binding transcriptional LysR family regulator